MLVRVSVVLFLSLQMVAAQQRVAPESGRVSGQVVDAIGNPIPATEVWLTKSTEPATKLRRGMTDGEGVFVIGRVPFRTRCSVWCTTKGRMLKSARVYVTPTTPVDTALLRLWDAATITGRVLDAEKKPIAGASVVATFDVARGFGFSPHGVTTTDAKGRFELHKIPLGDINVRAVAKGYVMQTERTYLKDSASVELRLEKGKGIELQVEIDGLDGDTARTVGVRLMPYLRGSYQALPDSLIRGTFDTKGRWSVAGLPDYEFRVSCSGTGLTFQPRNVRLKAGEGPHEATFKGFVAENVVLRGRVVGSDGKLLAGESVLCRAANGGRRVTGVTNAKGEFEIISPLAPGVECVMYLTRSRFVLEQNREVREQSSNWYRTLVDPKKTYELKARLAFSVRGRVTKENGRPVRFQSILLQKENPANMWPRWSRAGSATTDSKGDFRVFGLRPSKTLLRVQFAGRSGAGASKPFVLPESTPNQELVGISVQASAPASVGGVVLDAAGKPIPGARVWLRNCDKNGNQTDGAVFEVLTDRKGRYRHLGVTPGGHYLQVIVEGGTTVQLADGRPTFVLKPGESPEFDLRLQ